MLGTVDCLVITLFTNHIDVKFGAIAGTAIIVPGPGVTDVMLGNQTLVCSNGKLGVRFGWQLSQRGCQQEKGLFDQSNDCPQASETEIATESDYKSQGKIKNASKQNSTKLRKHIWNLKDKNIDFEIKKMDHPP